MRALIESSPVAIYYTDGRDPPDASAYVNGAFREMFGLAPGQNANDWLSGIHPDDQARMLDAWADFCREPRPVQWEYRIRHRIHGVRYLSEQVLATRGVPGFVGTITDITDITTTRDSLGRMESLYRSTFEQAAVGIVYAGRDGGFVRFNPAFCRLLGFAPGDLEGRTLHDITYREDLAFSRAELERLWSGEIRILDIETRFLRKGGAPRWVRMTTSLLQEGNGAPVRSVGFVRDIAARVDIAAALQQNKALLEAVIAELPVALLACDAAGHITHFNHAAAELLSIPAAGRPESISPERGRQTADIYLADGITPIKPADRPLARALSGETIRDLELVVVPPGSTPRTVLFSARRLLGKSEQEHRAVAVLQDITQRKASDQELVRVHRQLLDASRQAGMAEVASNVLHDVGNVLNSVNISASVVTENVIKSKSPDVQRVAALMLQQGDRLGSFLAGDEHGRHVAAYLASLGEQLLAEQSTMLQELTALRANLEHIKDIVTMQQSYARLGGVAEPVDAVDLVEDSLRLNYDHFARRGMTLRREFSPVPAITVDRNKVLQILVNLISNAEHACDESDRPDKLVTVRVARSEDRLQISVIDNGVGIPVGNLTRIFNHGFTTRKNGHGFGLHSSALAAQDLGGSLLAASDGPACGATFTLELPYSPGDGASA